MDFEQILVDRRDDVLILTLNRPEKLNAWTPKMSAELVTAITAANDDDDIGAIVVTGAGRGFCAGADISGQFAANLDTRQEDPAPAADRAPQSSQRESRGTDWVTLCRQSKPLVAAINGPCIGVGLTMVLPFDQLLAAEGARLSLRFVKMGLVPELASSHFMVTRCGWGAASWLALSGTTVFADEAYRLSSSTGWCRRIRSSTRRSQWRKSSAATRGRRCA
jgi:enoyl-CoA hydratase/carnithine racemase